MREEDSAVTLDANALKNVEVENTLEGTEG
jgi:hypothetical protein